MKRSGLFASVAGLLGALAVFAVMFALVDAGAVLAAASRADPRLLAVVAVTIVCWNLAWGTALWAVLRGLAVAVPYHVAVLLNAAASFANHVTPLGQAGGEPVTALLLTRRLGTDYEVSLATIASHDAINVVPSLTFATLGVLYLTAVDAGAGTIDALSLAILGVALTVPLLAYAGWRSRQRLCGVIGVLSPPLTRLAGSLPGLTPAHVDRLAQRFVGFADAIERLAVDRRRLQLALACSALGWAFQSLGLWVTFLALDASIPLALAFFVLPVGKVGGVFPTPGGLGGTEAINVALLALLTGVSGATIAAAVTIHSVGGYLLTTSVGAAATGVLGLHR